MVRLRLPVSVYNSIESLKKEPERKQQKNEKIKKEMEIDCVMHFAVYVYVSFKKKVKTRNM